MNYIKIIDFFQEALNLLNTAFALVGCSGNWSEADVEVVGVVVVIEPLPV